MTRPLLASSGYRVTVWHLAQHRAMGTRIVIGDKVKAHLAWRERKKKGWRI